MSTRRDQHNTTKAEGGLMRRRGGREEGEGGGGRGTCVRVCVCVDAHMDRMIDVNRTWSTKNKGREGIDEKTEREEVLMTVGMRHHERETGVGEDIERVGHHLRPPSLVGDAKHFVGRGVAEGSEQNGRRGMDASQSLRRVGGGWVDGWMSE